MLVAAKTNPHLHAVLSHTDLKTIDGIGLALAAFLKSGRLFPRLTGSDVMTILLEKANKKHQRVLLVGGKGDVSLRAMNRLKITYPTISFDYNLATQVNWLNDHWELDVGFLQDIRRFAPDILLVSLSIGKQETWIYDHLPLLPSVKVAVGIGGVFAFIAGDVPRAPLGWQRWGIEWFWRLIQEPRRIKRILTAVFVFPVLVVWDRIRTTKRTTL